MRIALALAALVAALAVPAGALASPVNHLTDGKYLPAGPQQAPPPELVVPSVRPITPAYLTAVAPVPAGRVSPRSVYAKPSGFDFGNAAIWLGVGLGVLALAGGALAVRRRGGDHGVPAQT